MGCSPTRGQIKEKSSEVDYFSLEKSAQTLFTTNPRKALRLLERAIELKKITCAENSHSIANSYSVLVITGLLAGASSERILSFGNSALPLLEIYNKRLKVLIMTLMATSLAREGNIQKAREYALNAVDYSEQFIGGNSRVTMMAILTVGDIHRSSNNLNDAKDWYTKAESIAVTKPISAFSYSPEKETEDKNYDPLDIIIDEYFENKIPNLGFIYGEIGKMCLELGMIETGCLYFNKQYTFESSKLIDNDVAAQRVIELSNYSERYPKASMKLSEISRKWNIVKEKCPTSKSTINL